MSRKHLILFDSIFLIFWVLIYFVTGKILFIPISTIYQWGVLVLFFGMISRHINYYRLTHKLY